MKSHPKRGPALRKAKSARHVAQKAEIKTDYDDALPYSVTYKNGVQSSCPCGKDPAGGEWEVETEPEALRNDDGKARLDMIPARALFGLARVYEHGAKKYEPNNWRAGTGWSRVVGALLRHAMKFNSGETYDQKSGQHHMLHVAFWALALYEWSLDQAGTDDRYLNDRPIEEPEEVEAGA